LAVFQDFTGCSVVATNEELKQASGVIRGFLGIMLATFEQSSRVSNLGLLSFDFQGLPA
jgi:hypothetical protein